MDPIITDLYSFVGGCHKKKWRERQSRKWYQTKNEYKIWVYKITPENENRKLIQSQHKSNRP